MMFLLVSSWKPSIQHNDDDDDNGDDDNDDNDEDSDDNLFTCKQLKALQQDDYGDDYDDNDDEDDNDDSNVLLVSSWKPSNAVEHRFVGQQVCGSVAIKYSWLS